MNPDTAVRRRNVLLAAGAGLATSVLGGAIAQAQVQTLDVVTRIGPATSELKGKLYAAWKDTGADAGLWYASFDGSKWSVPARIPRAATSAPPSLATFGNRLYAVWKGRNVDLRLWYASFDGSEWSPHAQIPGAASDGAPALSVFNKNLDALWKGSGDVAFSFASFDGSAWSSMPNAPTPVKASIPPNGHPFSPQTIANSGQGGAGGINQGKRGDCVFEASAAAGAIAESW